MIARPFATHCWNYTGTQSLPGGWDRTGSSDSSTIQFPSSEGLFSGILRIRSDGAQHDGSYFPTEAAIHGMVTCPPVCAWFRGLSTGSTSAANLGRREPGNQYSLPGFLPRSCSDRDSCSDTAKRFILFRPILVDILAVLGNLHYPSLRRYDGESLAFASAC